MSKSNANPSNNAVIKPKQASVQMRSLLNPNSKVTAAQQNNEQLFARLQNPANAVVLQDASTGKSATVHLLKGPTSSTASVSEATGPQAAQFQYVSCAKSTLNSKSRPQIVYIKGRNSSPKSTIAMRQPVQILPNFNQSIIKPVTITKIVPNSNNASAGKILMPKASDVAFLPKTDSPICILNAIKTSSSSKEQHPVIVVSTTTIPTSASNQKVVFGPNLATVPTSQTSNVSYVNMTPQMQSKGPIINFKISDGKINEDSINFRGAANMPALVNAEHIKRDDNMPPLKPIQTHKDMAAGNYKENGIENGELAVNEDLLKLNTNAAPLTSILKRNSQSSTENSGNENKLQPVDQLGCNNNVTNVEILEKSNSEPATVVKSQRRIKKQHLQVKTDLQEACIEVLDSKHSNIRKKKCSKTTIRKIEPLRPLHADPIENLIWKDGIGTLSNTDMHFKINEFGLIDLLSELEYDALITGRKDSKYHTPLAKRQEIQDNVRKSTCPDDVYKCLSCSSCGPAIEFVSPDFCSTVCADTFKEKKREQSPKQDAVLPLKDTAKSSVISMKHKPIDEHSNESDVEEEKNSLYPWMLPKRGFSWSKYMTYKKTKAAPTKLFKDPFPYQQNGFRMGMKLEAIDPNHESYICVVSVVDVRGFRICLHFDSYPRDYDFWVNADSTNIFPAGWCEKNNRELQPPKYLKPDTFSWAIYLKQCKSVAAPRNLFPHVTSEAACPHGFRVGMKLEALDKKNSHEMCVATVADILFPQRFLVHFDGWDEMYDYWVDATSPYIHPVGWCEEQNATLIPPAGHSKEKKFNWDEYLKQTGCAAVPSRAFKRRPMSGFSIGMKIEAVDIRLPFLVRVATVADVKDHSLKVSFDGWPPRYSFWVEDDSPDIHPVGWCAKTAHRLEPPLMPEDVQASINLGCGVPGCTGLGNVYVPHKTTHTSDKNCPYALKNLNVRSRMGVDRLLAHAMEMKWTLQLSGKEQKFLAPPICDDQNSVPKITTNKRISGDNISGIENTSKRLKSGATNHANEVKGDTYRTYVKTKPYNSAGNIDKQEAVGRDLQDKKACSMKINAAALARKMKLQMPVDVATTVFSPSCVPSPLKWRNRPLWLKYSQPLSNLVKKTNKKLDPRLWTITDVVKFINNIPRCADHAYKFEQQLIDGESFLMLSLKDLLNQFNLKAGPAIKIHNSIMVLREQMH